MRNRLALLVLILVPIAGALAAPASVIATIPLTPAESQLLDEGRPGRTIAALDSQASMLRARLDQITTARRKASSDLQACMARILGSRSPAVAVPVGAFVVRQRAGSKDVLLIEKP